MKRILLIGGMILVLLAMAFTAVSGVNAAPHPKEGRHAAQAAKITWSQKAINTTLAAGQRATVTVTFTSTADIASPSLAIIPQKASFVQVSNFPASVRANTPYSIDVKIDVPADTARNELEAGLFVKDQRVLAKPMPVHVKVPKSKPTRIE